MSLACFRDASLLGVDLLTEPEGVQAKDWQHKDFLCSRCGSFVPFQMEIGSTRCRHSYCLECLMELINDSLSECNTVPKCVVDGCDEEVRFSATASLTAWLLPKYQPQSAEDVDVRQEYLVAGYVRAWEQDMPTELVLLIAGFYSLQKALLSAVQCEQCHATGRQPTECADCDGQGQQVVCLDCHSRVAASSPQCWEICPSCEGFGSLVVACSECKSGEGWFAGPGCDKCSHQGLTTLLCTACNGSRTISKPHRGDVRVCGSCQGRGVITKHCASCQGHSALMAFDFGKVCKLQQRCPSCETYCPPHWMIPGMDCDHAICRDCFGSLVSSEIARGRIPKCLVEGCGHQLTIATMLRWQLRSEYSHLAPALRKLVADQRQFQFQRNRFRCALCTAYHPMRSGFRWTECDHWYCVECAKGLISRSVLQAMARFNDGVPVSASWKTVLKLLPGHRISCIVPQCHSCISLEDAEKLGPAVGAICNHRR